MKKTLSLVLALLFYASILPWTYAEPWNIKAKNITGDGTGTISGFNIPLYLSNYLSMYDAVTRWVDVVYYGAVTPENVQSAVNDNANIGKIIVIPPGFYSWAGTVTLPDRDIEIWGYGAEITQTGSVPTFLQTHNVFTRMKGLSFKGNGNGLKWDVDWTLVGYGTSATSYDVSDCKFQMDNTVYGLYNKGAGTSFISNSRFYGPGSGVYYIYAINPVVRDSVFRGGPTYGGNGIYADGVSGGYSAGMSVVNCEIFNWDNGVLVRENDWFNMTGTLIDFNTHSLTMLGVNTANVSGNQFGNSSVDDYPTIVITNGPNRHTQNVVLSNNQIVAHSMDNNTHTSIQIDNSEIIQIVNNGINFWTKYGIVYDNTATRLDIFSNIMAPRIGTGVKAIYGGGNNDASIAITWNSFNSATLGVGNTQYATLRENRFYSTRWSSVALVDNTAVVVNHLLDMTPAVVTLTPNADHTVWVTDITSTQFTINTSSATPAFLVYWTAEKPQGN